MKESCRNAPSVGAMGQKVLPPVGASTQNIFGFVGCVSHVLSCVCLAVWIFRSAEFRKVLK